MHTEAGRSDRLGGIGMHLAASEDRPVPESFRAGWLQPKVSEMARTKGLQRPPPGPSSAAVEMNEDATREAG